MKLSDKYTPDQMAAAKKTVTVTTEIDGQKFVKEFDGTQGLVVMVINDDRVIGMTRATVGNMVKFGASMFNDLSKKDPQLLLLAISIAQNIKDEEAEAVKGAVL